MVSKPAQNRPWKHLSFITIQIVFVSISNGCQMKQDIMAFIDNRGFPGGPFAWFTLNYTETPISINHAFGFLSFWMQDAFLVSTMRSFRVCNCFSRCTASTSFTDQIFITSFFLVFYSGHLFVGIYAPLQK